MTNALDDFIINAPSPARKRTDEQEAIAQHQLKPSECLKVIAYAGTGKTTTLVDYAAQNPGEDMLYLAFNKSVETEAKNKFGPNVVPKTVHALAYGLTGYKFKRAGIQNGLKSWEIAKMARCDLYTASIVRNSLENFLNSADMCPLPDHIVDDELNRLKDNYKETLCETLSEIFDAMSNEHIPMTHGGYLKLCQLGMPQLKWKIILLDEAQDTNPVTLALLSNQLQYGTKIILVGDPYQQIYSWRGAIDALAKVECTTLRLTKSFRFGENIAHVANRLLSVLFGEAVPVVGTEQPDEAKPKSCIISRTNAEMFLRAAATKEFSVVGEQRFKQLLDDLSDLYNISRGGRARNRVFARYRNLQEVIEQAMETLDYELQMKASVVKECGTELPRMIDRVEQNMIAGSDIMLTTAHQSKGLEWQNVELSSDFPSLQNTRGGVKTVVDKADMNSEDTIAKEECNLLYVACTRAKKKLSPGSSIERFTRRETPTN